MARPPKPWYWKRRKRWYVCINGKQVNLGTNKADATKAFHRLMADEGTPAPVAQGSIAEVFEHYLDWSQKNQADRTYDFYRERLERFLKAYPTLTVAALRPHHVQTWLDKYDWSASYKRGVITAVKRAFNWSVKQGYLTSNPIKALEKPEAPPRDQIISADDWALIHSHVPDDHFRDLLNFIWETGCRPQEARLIDPEHFDESLGTVTLLREDSKGKKHRRVLYLTDEALEILKRNSDKAPVFQNTKGRPWTAFAINCRFDKLKKKIGNKFCCYNIRHTFATNALMNGVDPVTLANLMGHKDTTMISRIYAHLQHDPEFMRRQAQKAIQKNAPS